MNNSQNIKIDLELILKNQKVTPGKQKVLISSIQLFSKYGFNGVSTADIAKNANVSEATIFKYFKNKRGLLISIITPIVEHCIPSYEGVFADQIEKNGNTDLKTLVHFTIDNRIQFLKQNKEIICIFLSQLIIDEKIRNDLMSSLQANHSENAAKIFEAFNNTKELADDITYFSLLRIIMGQLLIYFTQIHLFNNRQIDQSELELQIFRALKKEN